ncbi:hypothetical protein G647_06466 [Cladophialophora carrionii CBS 160.54]|uniref:JmjC domain-containing protein n=1 Tax=Cladophialophora carrionii CBS 160.54 TaxID=1279043 RepID=V9D8V8_9EURO|nr:uncharacterized protein G647_06466 [Cladophialophora carrionii CBS 160.54]ETI22392.1 hypothetical protein G647_06466 [Cladophialophora carrionii CBS 160.54]
MPSTRPCAAFEPIAPDFDLKSLVESQANFEWVVRIHCDMIDHQGLENFDKLVLIHVILGGKPLVIEGYEGRLDRWTFALQWLRDNCGSKVENARDLTKKTNVPLTIGHYLNNMALLTNQWTPQNYKDPERQRMYLKDIDCPQLWRDKLAEILPPGLFYLNESTGDLGGYGAMDENDSVRPGTKKGRGIAKAGDLMSSLPNEMRAENLMCYVGHEGTYTPAHREMCASLGQNIMVEASTGLIEDGRPTGPGSSIWFMTESKEREVVSEYWLSRLGHDIEIENHFAQVNAWKNAPFKVYIVEQKPGDFILIPPLAPHQVWNRGTRTMKVAWNRTTVETLELALHEALPRARMVCRDEQYKNKAIIYYTMQKYSKLLRHAEKTRQRSVGPKQKASRDAKVRQLEKDFRRLEFLFTEILVSESFFPDKPEKKVELVPYDSNITCSYCRCNIFNRFLTCPNCVGQLANGDEDTYDICMDCYAMGRSCACISKLKWVEQWSWEDLTQKHEQWRQQILQYEGKITEKSPVSLKIELGRRGNKRTLAQICQLELSRRPFRDIARPPSPAKGDEEVEVIGPDGSVKIRKKIKRTDKFLREHARCHTDSHWEPKWKQAACTQCDKRYCYGTLFRRFDMMPQDILADPNWTCPSCKEVCSCRPCRQKAGYDYRPYSPSGTMLGHNTKAVADPRSVESLVDFSVSNIGWIQKADDDHGDQSRRLKKRRKEADAAKANEPELGEDYVDDDADMSDGVEAGLLRLAEQEGFAIDPALGTGGAPTGAPPGDDDDFDENPESARRPGDLTPSHSPAALPEGGVIRDLEHAYDRTEAITYDYPDPSVALLVSGPAEEGQTALPPGYVPARPEESMEIEMVRQKRKRAKTDDGDRAYNYKKPNPEKQKQRKSLIVKLSIPIEKLNEMEKTADLARRPLNGTLQVPAPVIGSDLQALNAAEGNPQAVAKKVRREPELIEVERDDEFMPGRYRDRRKRAQDGAPLPPPDTEITRRQTRKHQTRYEEPSEDEFKEMLGPNDRRNLKGNTAAKTTPSNVVRSSDLELDFDDPDLSEEDIGTDSSTSIPAMEIGHGSPDPATRAATKAPGLAESGVDRAVSKESTTEGNESSSLITSPALPSKEANLAKPTSTGPAKTSAGSMAEAQANRRAKMALIESMEYDSDDLDYPWSQDSVSDEPATNGRTSTVSPPAPNKQSATDTQKSISGSARVELVKKPVIVSNVKASAADWVDSDDSDDDGMATRGAWASVNGGVASARRTVAMKTTNHVANGPVKRGRGRPAKHPK